MEHSKNYALLNVILGIMELMNAPWKLIFFIIPVGSYAVGLHFREYLELPFIPDRIKSEYDIFINSLLVIMFILLILAVLVTIGRTLYNKETKVFREALEKENKEAIHLIYKRKKGKKIERKIYSHTIPDKWNDKSIYLKILKIFDEHFETEKFVTDSNNSRITIMKTKEGFDKPIKEVYHDEILDKEMEELI